MKWLWPALLPLCAQAADVGGIELPGRWSLGKTELVLNGAGVREYGFLGLDVYAAALYLPSVERESSAVLDAPLKLLHMHFFRDASREDTLKAWQVYLEKNCTLPACTIPPTALAHFNALIPATVKGETQTFVWRGARVQVLRNGQVLGEMEDAAFARLLLSTWIGAVPTTEDLKTALLGR